MCTFGVDWVAAAVVVYTRRMATNLHEPNDVRVIVKTANERAHHTPSTAAGNDVVDGDRNAIKKSNENDQKAQPTNTH